MNWIRLSQEKQASEFLQALTQLYAGLFNISGNIAPWFVNFWLKRFNECDFYMLGAGANPQAVISVHRGATLCWDRPRWNTLVLHPQFCGPIELPAEIQEKELSFVCPALSGDPLPEILGYRRSQVFLEGYWLELGKFSSKENTQLEVSVASPTDLDWITTKYGAMSDRGYSTSDLAALREEIIQAKQHGTAWVYVARAVGNREIVGFASYIGFEVPVLGVPAVFVSDVFVEPNFRGRGYASAIQSFAYSDLKKRGCSSVFGWIEAGNVASVRQAVKLGRAGVLRVVDCHSV